MEGSPVTGHTQGLNAYPLLSHNKRAPLFHGGRVSSGDSPLITNITSAREHKPVYDVKV